MQETKVILLTWPSGSGKSSIVERLKQEYNIIQPIQFTTRQPRNDKELDTYCFLSKEQFLIKLENGDFSEFTYYNWHWYWISAHFKSGTNIVIVEPVGFASLKKYLRLNNIPFFSIFLDIDKNTMIQRLGMGRRESVNVIEERMKDLLYFSPDGYNYTVDAKGSFEEVYRHITQIMKTNNIT